MARTEIYRYHKPEGWVMPEKRVERIRTALRYDMPLPPPSAPFGPEYRKDALSAERWTFFTLDRYEHLELRLASYARMVRTSPRHKWRIADNGRALWDNMDERAYHSGIKRAEVPLPLEVQRAAVAAVKVEVLIPEGMPLAEVAK